MHKFSSLALLLCTLCFYRKKLLHTDIISYKNYFKPKCIMIIITKIKSI